MGVKSFFLSASFCRPMRAAFGVDIRRTALDVKGKITFFEGYFFYVGIQEDGGGTLSAAGGLSTVVYWLPAMDYTRVDQG
jgi:hypothetical protein